MAYNVDFYGENGYRLTTTSTANVDIRCANFNGNGTEVAGQLKSAVLAGQFDVGEDLDGSIQTHGIPPYGEWNTLNDFGAFGYLGIYGENNQHDTMPTPTLPILWGYHRRSNNTYSHGYCVRKVKLQDVLWGTDKTLGDGNNSNQDAMSLAPIVQMDYKNFFVVPVVLCSNMTYNATEDEYGRYSAEHNQFNNMHSFTLDTYLKNYWDTYPLVHGIYYVTYLCRWIEDPQTQNLLPTFSDSGSLLPNGITPFINKKFGFSIDTLGGPTDGTIVATGSDFCSPWLPANGVTITYTRTSGSEYTLAPSSGNFMYVLGCNTNTAGSRQLAYSDPQQYTYDGVTPAYGFSHLRMIKSNAALDSPLTAPIWFDKPTNKADFKEAVHKMMSWLAIPWADEVGGVETGATPIYIGTLDDNGIATGEYVVVTNPDEVPQMASDDFINDNHYDPGKYPDNYDYDSEIGVKNIQTGNVFCRAYAVNNEVKGLSQYLWNTVTGSVAAAEAYPVAQKELSSKFLTTNPVDNIVSLIYYPFNIKEQLGLSSQSVIGLGNQVVTYSVPGSSAPLTLTGYKIDNNMQVLLDAGSLPLQPFFNDFRDYEPYTTLELFIPYHGSITLLNSEVLDHMLSVKIAVDLLTGSSTAFIFRDNLIIDQINGNMGVSIPINGLEQATYNANIYNANSSLKIAKANEQLTNVNSGFQIAGQAANALANGAMGNIPGAIGSSLSLVGTGLTSNLKSDIAAQQVANAQFNLDHTTKPIKNCGAPTGSNSTVGEQYCRLIIRRPYIITRPGTDTQADYAENVGFAQYAMVGTSDNQTHLGVFSGHVEMTNVKVNGNMTSKEKELIKTALMNGVHIK